MSSSSLPKAVLYGFGGSVWASVPALVAIEKNFTENELERRVVNLLEGENFAPAYLKVSPKGTVPALVAPIEATISDAATTQFKSFTETIDICKFLDAATHGPSTHEAPSLSPATVQGASEAKVIIDLVHGADAPDPNAFFMSFRSDEERKAKDAGVPGLFLRGRQKALLKYQQQAGDADGRLERFYEVKVAENGGLLKMYTGEADSAGWIAKSNEMWAQLEKTIEKFETLLSGTSTYLVGDQIALADLHAVAYWARIFAVSGASRVEIASAVLRLEDQLPSGKKFGPKLIKWLEAVFARESAKEVYKDGFH